MPSLLRVVPRLLLIAAIATLLFVFRQWAYVTTYRLYLDHRVDDAVESTATQRFDVEGARVVPRIVMRDDRVSFRAAIGQDSTMPVYADGYLFFTRGNELMAQHAGGEALTAANE